MNDPRTRTFITGCVIGGVIGLLVVLLAAVPLLVYLVLNDDDNSSTSTTTNTSTGGTISTTQIASMAEGALSQYATQNQWQYTINDTTVNNISATEYTVDFDVTFTDISTQTTFNDTVSIAVTSTNNVWNTNVTTINIQPPPAEPADVFNPVGVWDNIDALLFYENWTLRADHTVIYDSYGSHDEGTWSFDGTYLIFTYDDRVNEIEFLGYSNGIMTVRASGGYVVRLQKVGS